MSENATKADIKRLDNKIDALDAKFDAKIDKAVEDLSEIIRDFAQQVSDRMDEMDIKYNHLINTIDGFCSPHR